MGIIKNAVAKVAEVVSPKEKFPIGYRITVKGLYFAKQKERGLHGGASERARLPYSESFDLPSAYASPQPALSFVIAGPLKEALTKKDPNFRGIVTHEVVKHEAIFEK